MPSGYLPSIRGPPFIEDKNSLRKKTTRKGNNVSRGSVLLPLAIALGMLAGTSSAQAADTVDSTGYCLTGRMANGEFTHGGVVAMNGVPLGTKYTIKSGPLAGQQVTVKDRIGHGSQFDVWFPSCQAARNYGRHQIVIERSN